MNKMLSVIDYKILSSDDLFAIIYQCQKELLKRKINTKFEDLRLKK